MIARAEWESYTPDEQFEYMHTLEKLLESSEEVLRLIPECPEHGPLCKPHAKEWIVSAKAMLAHARLILRAAGE